MATKVAEKPKAAEKPAPNGNHLYLVDGSGYIFRAFHALPPLTRPDGTPVGAVLGFTNMLLRLMADHKGDHLAVIFDAGRDTFRHEIYKDYKANRDAPPDELIPQFPLVREATKAFNVPSVEVPGFEADDLIACYAREALEKGYQVTIVSSDKDLMQLVRPGVDMLDPIKYKPIGEAEVRERFGVGPDKVVDVQALIGDSIDNVPGVPGIGPTAASACINKFGGLKAALEAAADPDTFADAFRKDAEAAEAEVTKLLGRPCKLGPTSRDLGAILFDELKIAGGQRDKKGNWDVGNEALQALAKAHKVIPLILECREKSRAASSAAGWAEKLTKNRKLAEVSLELVTLKDDCDLPLNVGDFKIKKPAPDVVLPFLVKMGFRALITRLKTEGMIDDGFDVDTVPKMANLAQAKADAAQVAAETPVEREKPAAPAARKAIRPAVNRSTYGLVLTMEALDECIHHASEHGIVAIDTETTSIDSMTADLVGISLSYAGGQGCYIPVGHVAPGTLPGKDKATLDLAGGGAAPPKQLPRDQVLAKLKPLFADPSVLKVGHHIKFDREVLARYGLAVEPFDDTMLISYVLGGGKHGHGMDEVCGVHFGHTTIKYDDVTGTGKSRINFAEVPLEQARDYAAEDADVTLCLHQHLKPMLVAEGLVSVYEHIERPLVPVIQAMEETGITVDMAELRRMSNDFGMRLQELETKIHKEAGRPFNIGSPQQLGAILFDEMGLQLPEGGVPKKTKTGAYATGADVLEDLAALGHTLPQLVLEWRQIAKLKSTYADALVEKIDSTGRVHTTFAMAATSTGRLSSSDPNLQNIPIRTEEGRKIRQAFVAGPGLTLLSFDYSQIELRLLAHVADIGMLKQAFRDNVDIHALTASQVFNVPVEGMDPMVRRKAKAINFGIIYGISAFGLANQLGIPQGEARAYIDAYFTRYPGIRDYMERAKAEARKKGYVTTVFGRRVHTPEIMSKNPAVRSFQERAAINAPIQGGAADVIKRAMVRIPEALAKAKLSAKMLLQVHDELLFEAPPAELDETIAVVKRVMESAALPAVELSVPLVVEVGHGRSWAEAH